MPWRSELHPSQESWAAAFFSSAFLSVRTPGFLSLDGTLNVSSPQEYVCDFSNLESLYFLHHEKGDVTVNH